IPPEAAKGGYDLVNQFGRVIRHVDGIKTPEQIAADKARAKAAQAAADQKRADRQLLLSYPSEQELTSAQNEHINMLQQRIKATEINMKSQLDGLANLLDKAAIYKQRGDSVPAYVDQDIEKQREVIRGQREWIDKTQRELDQATNDAASELARYRRLRGGVPAPAASVATPSGAASASGT
ncbi:MAG TPA: hypothetical protein VFN09_04715, partial [Rhodanobacteraceae bacterium]|nr:hypothetical protein [Rhodanobacteraceae bacterium]